MIGSLSPCHSRSKGDYSPMNCNLGLLPTIPKKGSAKQIEKLRNVRKPQMFLEIFRYMKGLITCDTRSTCTRSYYM